MRGYSTSKFFGTLYSKSPILAFLVLGFSILFPGLFLIAVGGNTIAELSYFLIIVGAIIIIITIIVSIISAIRKEKYEKALNNAILSTGINQVDNLSPYEFEDWVARFLNLNGFQATTTKRSGDFGADVIAYRCGTKYVISCKKYTKPLGIKSVQEILGAIDYYCANEGWVVSTAPHFSKQAYALAQSRNIKLFAKNDLALMLHKLQQDFVNKNKTDK